MKLSQTECVNFRELVRQWSCSPSVQQMKRYIQHGNTSTYEHCLAVAYYCLWMSRRLPFSFRYDSLVKAALLHDFYLYDWHTSGHKGHGFSHPDTAADNAERQFCLTKHESDIIRTHMFPLTLTKIPRTREAVVLCCVDKICSLAETLRFRYREIHRICT